MNIWLKFKKFSLSEGGTTAVEFALIILPLFALTFGIIDFGRFLLAKQEVSYAANTTYRAVVIKAAALDDTEITTLSAQLAEDLIIANSLLISTEEIGSGIKIDADYNFKFFLLGIYGLSTMNIHETLFVTVVSPNQ
jgi:Flp pilus assembly protein TadG